MGWDLEKVSMSEGEKNSTLAGDELIIKSLSGGRSCESG